MEERGLDALVVQNNSERIGGYVRWLTDMPASMYPTTVIFPRDAPMTVITHGPLGAQEAPGDPAIWRGVERVLFTASFAPAVYMREYEAELAVEVLRRFASIGLVGTAQMSFAFGAKLRDVLQGATLTEASHVVDAIKALKSSEEQELIRAAAGVQDAVLAAAFDAVEAGRKESDVTAVARRVAHELGSEAGILLCGAGPPGAPAPIAPRHLQNRVLREGDVFALLVEIDGPGGMYTEIGRTCTIGPVPERLLEEHEFVLEAQRYSLSLLRPGAAPADVFAAYNAYLREHGRPEERRIHCHGQGYDLVERPFVRHDETMPLAAGMNLACHPTYVHDGLFSWICDGYLIGDDGPGERLHATPQAIVER